MFYAYSGKAVTYSDDEIIYLFNGTLVAYFYGNIINESRCQVAWNYNNGR